MAPLIFNSQEGDEDDHKEQADHTENHNQATVSHYKEKCEDLVYI